MPESSPVRIHAALITVAVLFSLNYIISKLAMNAFNALTFAYLRVLGSALVLNFAIPHERYEPLSPPDRKAIVGLTLIGVILNQVMFLLGLSLTSAHIAAILMTTIPVFTLAIAIATGRERGSTAKIAGIALAAAGALLVVGGEGIHGTRHDLAGALLLVGNSLAYASYLVLSKNVIHRLSPRRVIARMFGTASLLMIPIAAVPMARTQWATIPLRAWIGLLLVIAGPTVAAYLLNAWALKHSDSSLVAVYTYVQPFLTAILAAAFLGEKIHGLIALAAAMIFGGVYLSGRPAPPAAMEEAIPGNPD